MVDNSNIHQVIATIRRAAQEWPSALIDDQSRRGWGPYQILVATILSLRTKDSLTAQIAPRLFALANSPQEMVQRPAAEIEQAIYPVGFYRTKAQNILDISHILLNQYQGQVPATMNELLQLPGVGRKTANLVITVGYGQPGICVDIHVHRITNRWGYVDTPTPEKTEFALRDKLPPEYWLEINALLVPMGQNLCAPTSPWCSRCPITHLCARRHITRSR